MDWVTQTQSFYMINNTITVKAGVSCKQYLLVVDSNNILNAIYPTCANNWRCKFVIESKGLEKSKDISITKNNMWTK